MHGSPFRPAGYPSGTILRHIRLDLCVNSKQITRVEIKNLVFGMIHAMNGLRRDYIGESAGTEI